MEVCRRPAAARCRSRVGVAQARPGRAGAGDQGPGEKSLIKEEKRRIAGGGPRERKHERRQARPMARAGGSSREAEIAGRLAARGAAAANRECLQDAQDAGYGRLLGGAGFGASNRVARRGRASGRPGRSRHE